MKFKKLTIINCGSKMNVEDIERLKPFAQEVATIDKCPKGNREIIAAIQDSDAIIVSLMVDLDEGVLSKCPNLRYVGVCGSSLRRIDIQAAEKHNIIVKNVLGYCDTDTALFVVGEMIKIARGLGPVAHYSAPSRIEGKTLGILGLGSVGKIVAKYGVALGMNILYFSRTRYKSLENEYIRFCNKKELLAKSDFVSIHTPPHVLILDSDDFDLVSDGAVNKVQFCLNY